MNDDRDSEQFSRRDVLRTSAVAAGTVVVGGAAVAGSSDSDVDAAAEAAGKRGGRAQLDGTVRRNEPFMITVEGTDTRNASCMSSESALQTYVTYTINYCDSDDDNEDDGTLYMMPDEAKLVDTEVYEIRAIQDCKANDLKMVAMGPSQASCN